MASPGPIEHLELGDVIGFGRESVVHRAVGREGVYAVKIQRGEAVSAGTADRFRREAALAAVLEHPSLPRVVAVGDLNGRSYLVREYVPGESLEARIDRAGPLPPHDILELGRQLAGALAEVHRHRLIHRDVRPANIIVDEQGTARLVDFGLVTRAHQGTDAATEAVGTLLYAAPEQSGMLRRPVDHRSDLYALGVVLFQAAAGKPPFVAPEVAEIVRQHATVPAPALSAVGRGASPALAAMVATLLQKDPDDRYQSAWGLWSDLQRAESLDEALSHLAASERFERALERLSHRSAAVSSAPTLPGSMRVTGRSSEVERLRGHWREVVGGSGAVVVIEGPPGAGKSRLARTFQHDIEASGALVIHATCQPDERTPYAALGRALTRLTNRVVEADDRAARERLSTALAPVAEVVASIAPDLYDALSKGFARMPGQTRSDEAQHFHESVADLLLRLAQSHAAAVLCIDDGHWLDEASLRVLTLVSRRLRHSRLMVLLTAESSAASDEPDLFSALGPTRSLKRIPLGPLTKAGMSELATSVLGGLDVSDELVGHVHTWSAGSPMAARNYLQLLVDMGALVPWWGRWKLTTEGQEGSVAERLGNLELPEDMAHLLLQRIEDLDDGALDVLTAAAVWGPRFRLSQVSQTVDESDVEVRNAIAEARRVHLIEAVHDLGAADGLSEQATYSGVHHLAYGALLELAAPERLRSLHQRVAELLDGADRPTVMGTDGSPMPYVLARHYALGEREKNPDRVCQTNIEAARLAMSRHANELALQFLSDAEVVETESDLPATAELEELRGEALARTGGYDQALTHFRRALATHHDPLERASLRARMAEVLLWGRFETSRALAEVRAGLAELNATVRSGWLGSLWDAGIMWIAGRLMSWTGFGFGGADSEERPRLKILERLHNVGGLCAYFDVDPRLMAQMIGRSLFAANRLGPSEELVNHYVNHVVYLAVLGRERSSDRYLRRAVDLARTLEDPALAARAALYGNVAQHLLGHSARSQTATLAYIAQNERWLPVWDHLGACADLGWNLLIRGYAREGWEVLFAGLRRARVLSGEPMGVGTGIIRRYPSILWAGTALTVIGRAAEGARLIERGSEFAASCGPDEKYFRAALASQKLAIALETGQIGPTANDAMADFERVGVGVRLCPFYLRDYFVYAAYVRLEQCQVASPEERLRLLPRAKRAIKRLARAATHPSLEAHLATAWASYYRLRGKLDRAARWLDRAEARARHNDNRWVRFRAEVERAQLLELRGEGQAAIYEAELALGTARQAGWTERARQTEHRFDVSEREHPGAFNRAIAGRAAARPHIATADAMRLHRHLDALLELSLASSMVLHPDQQARVALDEIVRLLNAERAFLFLYSEEAGALELAAGRHSDAGDLTDLTGYASTVVEQVWTNLEPMVVSGTQGGPSAGRGSDHGGGIRSIIAAPLMIRDRLLGVVYLDSKVARGIFTEDDVQILLAVANHIAIALEAARSAQLEVEYQVERRERRLAEALRKATNQMAGTLEMGQVLMRLLESLSELVPHDSAAVLLRHGEAYTLVAGRGYEDQDQLRDLKIQRGEDPLLAQLEQTRRAVVIADVTLDTRYRPLIAGLKATVKSWIGVPLLSGDEVIGMLTLEHHEAGTYSEYDAEMASTFASQAAIGLDNARLFGEVQRLAVIDGLTGTFNRRHFFELAHREYGRAERYQKPLSLLMFDIDNFKAINDTHGHPAGDEVLRVVAKRAVMSCRDVDFVGRYGGEEFAILLPETPMQGGAQSFAERLRAAIDGLAVPSERGPLHVTISVGVASIAPGEGGLEGLIDRADQALLSAKAKGKNRVEIATVPAETR